MYITTLLSGETQQTNEHHYNDLAHYTWDLNGGLSSIFYDKRVLFKKLTTTYIILGHLRIVFPQSTILVYFIYVVQYEYRSLGGKWVERFIGF